MENKVNIADLLNDCPSGMKLNCLMYEDVYFDYVKHNIIHCYIQLETHKSFIMFNQHGTTNSNIKSKCVIFPPGKTTWDGFVPPCKFKDGDIISNGRCICIYNGNNDNNYYGFYVGLGHIDFPNYFIDTSQNSYFTKEDTHLATEEEKQKLFDAIKENGYHWNEETKSLEKLVKPKFKDGDRVKRKNVNYTYIVTISEIDGDYYGCVNEGGEYSNIYVKSAQDNWELVPDEIEPKFKVGDRVKHKQSFISGIITNIDDDCYKIKYDSGAVSFAIINDQDDWELVLDEIEPKFKVGDKIRLKGNPNYIYNITGIKENKSGCGVTFDLRFSEQDKNWNWFPKFDISTLKPFKSEVLVRDSRDKIWKPAIFGCFAGKASPYCVLGGICWKYCIPYEGNEHLCGKTDDCDEYYKTWE
jgi:hypothetical protein